MTCALAALLLALAATQSDVSSHLCRVTCRIGTGAQSVATGLLWPDQQHVLTALHVIANARLEDVSCRAESTGDSAAALEFERVLLSADLVLLRLGRSLDGKPAVIPGVSEDDLARLHGRKPINLPPVDFNVIDADEWKDEPVTCWSYREGAQLLHKADLSWAAGPAKMNLLVSQSALHEFKDFGFPNPRKPIVVYNGELTSGSSGAPVWDSQLRPIGLISGGETGGPGISWAFPLSPNASQLLASDEEMPSVQPSLNCAGSFWRKAGSLFLRNEEDYPIEVRLSSFMCQPSIEGIGFKLQAQSMSSAGPSHFQEVLFSSSDFCHGTSMKDIWVDAMSVGRELRIIATPLVNGDQEVALEEPEYVFNKRDGFSGRSGRKNVSLRGNFGSQRFKFSWQIEWSPISYDAVLQLTKWDLPSCRKPPQNLKTEVIFTSCDFVFSDGSKPVSRTRTVTMDDMLDTWSRSGDPKYSGIDCFSTGLEDVLIPGPFPSRAEFRWQMPCEIRVSVNGGSSGRGKGNFLKDKPLHLTMRDSSGKVTPKSFAVNFNGPNIDGVHQGKMHYTLTKERRSKRYLEVQLETHLPQDTQGRLILYGNNETILSAWFNSRYSYGKPNEPITIRFTRDNVVILEESYRDAVRVERYNFEDLQSGSHISGTWTPNNEEAQRLKSFSVLLNSESQRYPLQFMKPRGFSGHDAGSLVVRMRRGFAR